MQLRLFGPVSLRDEAGADPAGGVPQPKRIAVLAYLAMARGEFVRRDTLLALFWPDATEKDARGALNQAVHYLRRVVGAELVLSGGAETLAVDRRLWCDVIEFDDAIRDGRHERALELYRGDLMDGFYLSDLPEFEQWLNTERARRAREAADAAWMLSEATVSTPGVARQWAARAHNLSPDEGSTRRLMRLLARLDDRAGAIRAYDVFARHLRDEYGAEPAEATRDLIVEIRGGAMTSGRPLHSQPLGTVQAIATIAEPRRTPVWFTRRRALLAAGFVGLATVIAAWGNAARTRAKPADDSLAAVLPFAYHGVAENDYLREGVASLLASNLVGASGMRTVDPGALFGAVSRSESPIETPADARAFAARFGAGTVITGDITIASGRVRLTATLTRDGSETNDRVVAEGNADDLFRVVDDLAGRLVVRTAGAPAYRTADATTHSVAALKAYMKGDADYRSGHYASAVDALKRAVAIDTTFALAYYRLATAANWTGDASVGWAQKLAYHYRDRLSPLDRQKVEAWVMLQERGRPDSAEQAYSRIVAEQPTDIDALFHLADLRFHHGTSLGHPLREAGAEWARLLALDPGHAGAIVHAARVAAAAGDRARFDSLARQAERIEVDVDRAIELRLLRAFAFGDRAERVAAARGLDGASGQINRDVIAMAVAASPVLDDVLELLGPRFVGGNQFANREDGQMLVRGQIELARGRLRMLEFTLDSTAMLHPGHAREFRALFATLPLPAASPDQRRAIASELATAKHTHSRAEENRHYLLGTLAVRNGDSTTALRHATALDAMRAPADTAAARRFAKILRAEVLHTRGDDAGALAALGEPRSQWDGGRPNIWAYPLAHGRFLRAEILGGLGRYDEAQRWYATFPDSRIYDAMFRPAVLLKSAELYERTGQRNLAAGQYRRLLAMWAQADPGLDLEIRDIRERLRRLR